VCTVPGAVQPACEIPPPPPPKCEDFSNTTIDCQSCLLQARAIGLNCSYCPPPNGTNSSDSLVGGTCHDTCPGGVQTCQPKVPVIPPVCPDNCSNNGICVNLSRCASLEKENREKYGNDSAYYLLSCGSNANISKSYNQSGACACFQGFNGLNCAVVGDKKFIALAALGAGLIALIVILAILAAALAGGGAAAVSTATAQNSQGHVVNSPIYEENKASGVNQLYDSAYMIL